MSKIAQYSSLCLYNFLPSGSRCQCHMIISFLTTNPLKLKVKTHYQRILSKTIISSVNVSLWTVVLKWIRNPAMRARTNLKGIAEYDF